MRRREKVKKTEKFKTILYVIIIIIIIPILLVNVFILIDSYKNPNEVPGFLKYKPFIVLSGSMEDLIKTGDLVIVEKVPTSELKAEDVIAFHSGDIVIVHRIIGTTKNENGELAFITKGDNNPSEDDALVTLDKVEGRYLFSVSKLGKAALFLQTPTGLLISISIPVLIIIVSQISTNKKYKKELEELRKQSK